MLGYIAKEIDFVFSSKTCFKYKITEKFPHKFSVEEHKVKLKKNHHFNLAIAISVVI
jgi:hypothetical protein